jgi:hypothetical protein
VLLAAVAALAAAPAAAGPAAADEPASISGLAPDGAQGSAYDFSYTLGGDPLPTVTWTGDLPPGLTLDAGGHLSGVPTASGLFTFFVTADNGTTQTLESDVTIAPVVPQISGTPPLGQVRAPYDFAFTTVGAPVVTTTDPLPLGLTLAPDGTITGTPSRAGTFHVTVTAHNGTLPDATLPVTLVVQQKPRITIADARMREGNSGYKAMVFTLGLSRPGILDVPVHWSTSDGTAKAGSDYRAASGTVTFPAGETTATLTVQIRGDRVREPNQTFFVNLRNPLHADLLDRQATGVIVDDD